MGVRSRAQREHFIKIRNGVIGHIQKPVCSHGSDLPGSEALGEIPAFPPPQLCVQTVNCFMGRHMLGSWTNKTDTLLTGEGLF
jgi:hypothetical protein